MVPTKILSPVIVGLRKSESALQLETALCKWRLLLSLSSLSPRTLWGPFQSTFRNQRLKFPFSKRNWKRGSRLADAQWVEGASGFSLPQEPTYQILSVGPWESLPCPERPSSSCLELVGMCRLRRAELTSPAEDPRGLFKWGSGLGTCTLRSAGC